MNGIGGDNFCLIDDATRQRLVGLNVAGRSAAAVDPERYRARFGDATPTRGGAAALTVRGAVSGWWQAYVLSRTALALPIRVAHAPRGRRHPCARGVHRLGGPAAGNRSHAADWVEALRMPYRSREAASLSPPTQGAAALTIPALLEGFDVAWLGVAGHTVVSG